MKLVASVPATPATVNVVPFVVRSIVKPCSLVVLSLHVTRIWVSVTGAAPASDGGTGAGGGALLPIGPLCHAGTPNSNAPMSGLAPAYPSVYGVTFCPASIAGETACSR